VHYNRDYNVWSVENGGRILKNKLIFWITISLLLVPAVTASIIQTPNNPSLTLTDSASGECKGMRINVSGGTNLNLSTVGLIATSDADVIVVYHWDNTTQVGNASLVNGIASFGTGLTLEKATATNNGTYIICQKNNDGSNYNLKYNASGACPYPKTYVDFMAAADTEPGFTPYRDYVKDGIGSQYVFIKNISVDLISEVAIITVDYPTNDSYNLGGGQFGYDGFINISLNQGENCSVNDTRWVFNLSSDSLNYDFWNPNYLSLGDGTYTINTSCWYSGTNTSKLMQFNIDTIGPSALSNIDNLTYTSVASTFTAQINYSDTSPGEVYKHNISLNNVRFVNDTGLSGTLYSYNLSVTSTNMSSLGLSMPGRVNVSTTICDAHTDNEINNFKVTKSNDKITFNDVWIKSDTSLNGIGYEKLRDRYTFEFYTNPIYELRLSVPKFCDYVDNSKYKGHFVCGNKWIDFEGDHTVTVNGHNVIVRSTTPKTKWVFNSVGELNCNSFDLGFFYFFNESLTYPSTSIEYATNRFTLNLSGTSGAPINATLIYNNTPYTSTYSGGIFIANPVAPQIPNQNQTNILFYWNYTAGSTKYNSTKINQTVYKMVLTPCGPSDVSNITYAINFTVQDETSGTVVTTNISASFDIWNATSDFKRTYSFSNQDSNMTICIWPPHAFYWSNIIVEYGGGVYDTRYWIKNVHNITNTTQAHTLYVLATGTSTTITVHVNDDEDNDLANVQVEAWQYDVATDTLTLVEVETTNTQGEAAFELDTSKQYAWRLYQDGDLKLSFDPFKIVSTDLYFTITEIETTPLEIILGLRGLDRTLSYSNVTKTVTYTWNDDNNIIDSICLNVTFTNYTPVYGSCSSADIGTHSYVITTLNASYVAYGYVVATADGLTYLLDSLGIDERQGQTIFNLEGIGISILIFLVCALLGANHPVTTVTMGAGALIILYVFNFMSIGMTTVGGIVVIGIVLIVRMNKS
jgi:hypothetical protein